jgi:hypothetical protein
MTEADTTAREAWKRFETIHGLTYFTPELREAGAALGLKGYWMAYFAFRVAPLGACGPETTTAVFYNFHARRVERALPEAWEAATPQDALKARQSAAAAGLRRVVGPRVDDDAVARAADLTWAASRLVEVPGRPLGAANLALPRPDDAYERLWLATTVLREHRGDGHNAALVAYGVGPAEAHILKSASGESDAAALQLGRQFTDDEWEAAVAGLTERGLLEGTALTDAGHELHASVERATDAAAATPWTQPEAKEAIAAMHPIAMAVVDSGEMPSPSPVGIAW